MISVKDIEKLASLARIKLPDGEKESLGGEIDSILEYVGQIQSASADAGVDSSKNLPEHRNAFRADSDAHESGVNTEALLAEAPEREGNYLKVKDIF